MVAPNEWEGETEEATVDTTKPPIPLSSIGASSEVNIEEELDAETTALRIAPDPGQLTRKQLADHRIIYSPYRIWRQFFVMGPARGTPPAADQTTTAGRL